MKLFLGILFYVFFANFIAASEIALLNEETYYQVQLIRNKEELIGAQIQKIDGSVVSTFLDCSFDNAKETINFRCFKGKELLEGIQYGSIQMISWTLSENAFFIFIPSDTENVFEQAAPYAMKISKTLEEKYTVEITYEIFSTIFEECIGGFIYEETTSYFVLDCMSLNDGNVHIVTAGLTALGTYDLRATWKKPTEEVNFVGTMDMTCSGE